MLYQSSRHDCTHDDGRVSEMLWRRGRGGAERMARVANLARDALQIRALNVTDVLHPSYSHTLILPRFGGHLYSWG
jgi:hypothetical protein